MPEIPEIASRASEMNAALPGKTIQNIEVVQPKCLNLLPAEFTTALTGATIEYVTYHGKWIKVMSTRGWLLLNLGMGGEILLTTRKSLPGKYRLIFDFTDGFCLVINFWWFGYAFYAAIDALDKIKMLAKLGPNVLDLSLDEFTAILKSQSPKTGVKAFMLDQSRVAGVGNAYIHDILFLAGLHPQRLLATLSDTEISALHRAIKDGLLPSLDKGGAFYETNLYGEKGGFQMEDILIGYHEGSPCPRCATTIEKIRTGSNTSFICPSCQPLKSLVT